MTKFFNAHPCRQNYVAVGLPSAVIHPGFKGCFALVAMKMHDGIGVWAVRVGDSVCKAFKFDQGEDVAAAFAGELVLQREAPPLWRDVIRMCHGDMPATVGPDLD